MLHPPEMLPDLWHRIIHDIETPGPIGIGAVEESQVGPIDAARCRRGKGIPASKVRRAIIPRAKHGGIGQRLGRQIVEDQRQAVDRGAAAAIGHQIDGLAIGSSEQHVHVVRVVVRKTMQRDHHVAHHSHLIGNHDHRRVGRGASAVRNADGRGVTERAAQAEPHVICQNPDRVWPFLQLESQRHGPAADSIGPKRKRTRQGSQRLHDAKSSRVSRGGHAAGGASVTTKLVVAAAPVFLKVTSRVTVSPGSMAPLCGRQLSAVMTDPA